MPIEPEWFEVTNGVWRIGVSRIDDWTALAVMHSVVMMDASNVEPLCLTYSQRNVPAPTGTPSASNTCT